MWSWPGWALTRFCWDNAGYPDQGNLHYIKKGSAYDETQFAAVITGFYAQVAAALADYPVKLSVVTTPEALTGTDALTGQTPDNLALFPAFGQGMKRGCSARWKPHPNSPDTGHYKSC